LQVALLVVGITAVAVEVLVATEQMLSVQQRAVAVLPKADYN
jgi:hypothetical protein